MPIGEVYSTSKQSQWAKTLLKDCYEQSNHDQSAKLEKQRKVLHLLVSLEP
jgi:hypothetical protein